MGEYIKLFQNVMQQSNHLTRVINIVFVYMLILVHIALTAPLNPPHHHCCSDTKFTKTQTHTLDNCLKNSKKYPVETHKHDLCQACLAECLHGRFLCVLVLQTTGNCFVSNVFAQTICYYWDLRPISHPPRSPPLLAC